MCRTGNIIMWTGRREYRLQSRVRVYAYVILKRNTFDLIDIYIYFFLWSSRARINTIICSYYFSICEIRNDWKMTDGVGVCNVAVKDVIENVPHYIDINLFEKSYYIQFDAYAICVKIEIIEIFISFFFFFNACVRMRIYYNPSAIHIRNRKMNKNLLRQRVT